MHFNQIITIVAKDRSSIIDAWELERAKLDKITLATNKSKEIMCIDYSISNTIAWEFGAAFVKEEGVKIVDSSEEKDWDIISSILKKAVVHFGLFIVGE